MISSQSVFIVAIVDGYLNRYRRVNQTNDGGWNSDKVCISTIGRTSEAAAVQTQLADDSIRMTTLLGD